MVSKTDIVNVALGRAQTKRLTDVDNDTNETAIKVRDLYDFVRKDLLESHNWNFAIKRQELAQSSTSPAWGWDYAYPLPDDFLRLVAVFQSDSDFTKSPNYRLEGMTISGNDRYVVLANTSKCYVRYVYDLKTPNMMHSGFRDALAWALARDFTMAIPGKVTLSEFLSKEAEKVLRRAKASDSIQDYPEERPIGSWAESRQGRDDTDGWGWT